MTADTADTAAPHPLIDEDELPPWLGERMRDTTHHIHRAAAEAAQEQDTTND